MNLVTRVSLGQTLLKNLPVLLPDIDTQKSIAEHLDKRCATIDRLTSKLSDEISLLSEYRTRLISDVVTGKLDVRDAVIPNYEAVEEIAVVEDDVNDSFEGSGDE